jgi:hypothetical protein
MVNLLKRAQTGLNKFGCWNHSYTKWGEALPEAYSMDIFQFKTCVKCNKIKYRKAASVNIRAGLINESLNKVLK